MYELEAKQNKLRDINAVIFGTNIEEITSSMEIIMMLFQIDDDKEIINACKSKLNEGIQLLKKIGESERSKQFEV